MKLATNASRGWRDELVGRRDLAQAPVDDHADAVGQRGRVAEVVGDDAASAAAAGRAGPGARRARSRACARRAPRAARRAAGRRGRARARGRARRAGARRRRRCPGCSPARWAIPRRSSSSSTRARRAAPKATLRRTVMCGNSAYSWKTRPTERASGGRSTRASRVEPHVVAERDPARGRAVRRPATARSTVVLPAPDGPTRATVSAPTVRRTASSYDRRAQAMSSSSVSTTTAVCRTAAPSR